MGNGKINLGKRKGSLKYIKDIPKGLVGLIEISGKFDSELAGTQCEVKAYLNPQFMVLTVLAFKILNNE